MTEMFDKARDLTRGHEAESDAILDKVAGVANGLTGGKFADQIQQARDAVDAQIGDEVGPADTTPQA